MNDPYDKITSKAHILKESIKARNTLTESEFREFLPLFKKDGRSKLGEARYEHLCKVYVNRVSLNHPVYIISDYLDEEGKKKVLLTLPPCFTSIPTFNEIQAANITDVFFNSVVKEGNNPLDVSMIRTSNQMSNLLAISAIAKKDDQDEYTKIMDEFYDGKSDNVGNNMQTKDLVWEEF